MDGPVLIERRGAVTVVTLNEPGKRNALSRRLRTALISYLEEIDADPSCRAVVLTGADGAFCAGGDISEMSGSATALERRQRFEAWRGPIRLITRSAKVFVAAVDGAAFGAGFSLAMLCDAVVAGPTARFSAAFSRIGLMPDLGLLWSLPARIGVARAKDLMITGEVVDAPTALRLGIADRLAGPGETVAVALARGEAYAAAAPASVAMIKTALARWPARLDEVLDHELEAQPLLATTQDHAEGKQAFFERRPARFLGG